MNPKVLAQPKSLSVYRELLRMIKWLPKESQAYYRNYLRENFVAHADEQDPDRVGTMLKKARSDAQWVLNKMTKGLH